MRYTYADITIDPSDPRLEGAIGKECFGGDNPKRIQNQANEDKEVGTLALISPEGRFNPFKIARKNRKSEDCSCIIIRKEKKQKYMPFDLSKNGVRDRLIGKWIVSKDSLSEQVLDYFWFNTTTNEWKYGCHSGKSLSYEFTFLDGTPCGIMGTIFKDVQIVCEKRQLVEDDDTCTAVEEN